MSTDNGGASVCLNPRRFKSSLSCLLEMFKKAPEADSAKIHSLDLNTIWKPVYCVGAVLSMEDVHTATGKGKQELTRYVMLDSVRLMEECEYLPKIMELLRTIENKIKMVESARLRRSLRGDLKAMMIYEPLIAAEGDDRYHLWAWDDVNKLTLCGLLPEKVFPQNIVTGFAAASLLDLGEEVLGEYGKELRQESDHCFSKIKRYLDHLSSLNEELT